MKKFHLEKEKAVFLFIDVQDKLINSTFNKEQVLKGNKTLSKMAEIMNMPSVITLQYPKGLGQMNDEVKAPLKDAKEIAKTTFSAMLNEEFVETMEKIGRKQVVISGVEAHICALFTARDLLEAGYEVFVASDAIGSRSEFNYDNSLEIYRDMGCYVTNVESIMFDLNSVAGTEEFKAVQKLIL